MRVRAKELGHYGGKRRRVGEEFDLVPRKGYKQLENDKLVPLELTVEQQFSERWMERIDGGAAPVKTSAARKSSAKVETPTVSDADMI